MKPKMFMQMNTVKSVTSDICLRNLFELAYFHLRTRSHFTFFMLWKWSLKCTLTLRSIYLLGWIIGRCIDGPMTLYKLQYKVFSKANILILVITYKMLWLILRLYVASLCVMLHTYLLNNHNYLTRPYIKPSYVTVITQLYQLWQFKHKL